MAHMSAYQLWTAEAIAPSGVATSAAIDIGKSNAIALHVTALTGTLPDVDFTYSVSTSKDGTYITGNSTFATAVAAADVLDLAPEAAGWIKIIATEAGGANTATLTAVLAIQDSD